MRVVRQSNHSLKAFSALCVTKGLLNSLCHALCLLYPQLSPAQGPVVSKCDVLWRQKWQVILHPEPSVHMHLHPELPSLQMIS